MTEEEVQETGETMSDAPARSAAEVMSIAEAIIFVSDEPITSKMLGEIMGEDKQTVQAAVEELQKEYEERSGGLQIREIAGGWQIATRTEYHEEIRKFLKTRPSAKLSLAALETLSVMVQVLVYKRTGRRVFLMAPIHHHFEKLGWQEPTIVIRFWIIAVIFALAGLSTLKLR